MTEFPGELQEVFRGYGEYHADVEASANFMPRLWERIEARRSPLILIRRTARLLVAGSLAAALLIGAVLIPQLEKQRRPAGFYADVVAHDNSTADQEYASVSLPVAFPSEDFRK
jgi:hypothetical protein